MKTSVNKILEFCKEMQERTGQENPEVDYDTIIKALFPTQWKLNSYYLHRDYYSEDEDPDCYCE